MCFLWKLLKPLQNTRFSGHRACYAVLKNVIFCIKKWSKRILKQNTFFRVIFRNRHPVWAGASFLGAPEAKNEGKYHVFWSTCFTYSSAAFHEQFFPQIMIFHNPSFYQHKTEFFAGIASCDINLWISENVPWQVVGNMTAPLGGSCKP